MAAYRADIEIGVRGAQQLQALTKQINTLSAGVDGVNKRLTGAAQSINAYNANLSKAAETLNRVNAGTLAERDAVKQYVQALGQANAARDRQNRLIQEQITLQRKAVATANAGFGVQGPALPPGSTATTRGGTGSGRAGNAISSAIIGGGFPLLFGQGPAAAAGGALGGIAGGLLGGGFGFALSIAGTAIGDFIAQADKLDVTLAGLNATIASTGATSITTASDVSALAKSLQITKDEAIALVAAFSQFNDGNIREALARGFGAVGGAQTFEAIAKAGLGEKEALDAIFSLRKQIGNEAAEQLALQLKSVGATETQAVLLKLVSERNIDILVAQSKTVQFADRLLSTWENIVAAVASSVSLAVRFIAKMQEGSLIKLPFLDRIQQVLGRITARTPEQIANERGANLEQQLRKDLENIRAAVRQETRAQGVQASLADALKPNRGGKSAAEREAERLAKQRQKQLEAAARMAVLTEGELQKTVAVTEQEKLNTEYAQKRMERMIKYETLYKEALSSAEVEYLLMAQSNEIFAENIKYEKAILDIQKEQTREMYRQLNAAGILDEQAQKRLGRGAANPLRTTFDLGLSLFAISEKDQALERTRLELEQLLNPIAQVTAAAEGIGSAFSTSFKGIVSGTMTAQEALAGFFQNIADQFLDMAAQIIAKWIQLTILNSILKIFPGSPTGSAASGGFTLPGGAGFAKGFGMESLITLPGRAAGGPVSAGSPYMVGERGPELFVPGRSGAIVPNNELGGGGQTNVVVNVDARGTSVEGNAPDGKMLGAAISAAVQQELIKQKRPGGLLSAR